MRTKVWTDPIVEQVRAARRKLLREANNDLKQLTARLMKSQKRHGELLVVRRNRTGNRKSR